MSDSLSLGVVLSVSALGAFAGEVFKDALKDWGKAPVKKALEHAAARFRKGELPVNHHLDNALRTALGQATCFLVFHLHEPGRRKLGDLLENFSDWPQLAIRLLKAVPEAVQNNHIAGNATDHWLAELIEQTKDAANFADLPLDLVLEDHQVTRLLEDDSDPALRAAVHDRFLAWVERHVPDNGGKPAGFAQAVREGTPVGTAGARLAFYDLVCVFFREHLKDDTAVFRAFTASVLTGLKGDLAEIRAALPDEATLRRFTDALAAFEDKEFDVSYARFKQHLNQQNDKVLALLRKEFKAVHAHLDRQDETLAAVRDTTDAHRRETTTGHGLLRRWLGWVAVGLALVLIAVAGVFWQQRHSLARLNALVQRDAPGSQLLQEFRQRLEAARFSTQKPDPEATVNTALAELARDHQLTVDALRQRLLQAAANAEERLNLTAQLRRAAEQESRRLREIEREAHVELATAAELAGRLPDALRHYQQALALADRAAEPQAWASLQNSLAGIHWNLGIRVEGPEAQAHLRAAVTAYRAALEVRTRTELPQDWATTQNGLGNTLSDQAQWIDGAEAVRLSLEAITAYRAALEVVTRVEKPQAWAALQNNLAGALRDQARLVDGVKAVLLLAESIVACHAALEIYTRERLPQHWAMTQNNLGLALHDQAGRSEGAEEVRLLGEAVAAYQAALEVYVREELPQNWAMTQSNLGLALHDQARRNEGKAVGLLLSEAVAAFRAALEVQTRTELPQNWALTQNNLGTALSDRANRSEGMEAVRLLGEALAAYRAALEVFTPGFHPNYHAMVKRNLGRTEAALVKAQATP